MAICEYVRDLMPDLFAEKFVSPDGDDIVQAKDLWENFDDDLKSLSKIRVKEVVKNEMSAILSWLEACFKIVKNWNEFDQVVTLCLEDFYTLISIMKKLKNM